MTANKYPAKVRAAFRRFRGSEAGNVTMILGLACIPLIACAGLAIDYVRGTRAASELQQVTDAAALAAAAAKNLPGTTSTDKMNARKTIAVKYLTNELPQVQDITVKGDPSVVVGPNTIDIAVEASVKASFIGVLNGIKSSSLIGGSTTANQASGSSKDIQLSIHSKIGYLKQSYVCLLATDNSSLMDQVYFQGNSEFMATCSVWANSKSLTAIETSGNSYAEAESFCSVGGWKGSGFSPDPTGGCTVKTDPYATKALPTAGTCLSAAPSGATIETNSNKNGYGVTVKNSTADLQPGTYCGGLHVQTGGIAKLKKGLYIIKNGTLDVSSGGSIYADGSNGSESGVVFYLQGTGTFVQVSSGGTFKVKGPSNATAISATSAYKGFAIMQDRAATTKETCTGNTGYNSISSQNNGDVSIEGAFYSPNQLLCVTANGDINASSKYFPMIVRLLKMNGTATLYVNNDFNGADLPEPVELKTPAKVSITQ